MHTFIISLFYLFLFILYYLEKKKKNGKKNIPTTRELIEINRGNFYSLTLSSNFTPEGSYIESSGLLTF